MSLDIPFLSFKSPKFVMIKLTLEGGLRNTSLVRDPPDCGLTLFVFDEEKQLLSELLIKSCEEVGGKDNRGKKRYSRSKRRTFWEGGHYSTSQDESREPIH
jgi:hypothetical protein